MFMQHFFLVDFSAQCFLSIATKNISSCTGNLPLQNATNEMFVPLYASAENNCYAKLIKTLKKNVSTNTPLARLWEALPTICFLHLVVEAFFCTINYFLQ